jgi:prepilin-type N-terminal cleavage/methylation domain-containing protein
MQLQAKNRIHNLQFRREGFTLIEMLIVIAIIGILASIVLVGLGPIQRQGRDTRRQGDLRQVQTALELYFNRCSHYPGGANCEPATGGAVSWDTLSDTLTSAGIGVSQIPNDPSSNGGEIANRNYRYATDSNGTTYVLQAVLEDDNNPGLRDSLTNDDLPAGITISCDSTEGEYCLAL